MFKTKLQIAIDLMDRALKNGVRVAHWTFDEFYGRDSKFPDELDDRNQRFVCEIPRKTRVWTAEPRVIVDGVTADSQDTTDSSEVVKNRTPCEVQSLLRHSIKFLTQSWQHYRIKDTDKGPEVWKIKHLTVWRQTSHGPPKRCTLIVARNVRTNETKFFFASGVVGERGVTLRGLLRVAFGRRGIEAELRVGKEELGMDHFEVRGWRCIHRHYYVTALSFLLCSRIRRSLDDQKDPGTLTIEQVRRSINCWLQYSHLPPHLRDAEFQKELDNQRYYQQRNAQARASHTITRKKLYRQLGIDVDKIKSCIQI